MVVIDQKLKRMPRTVRVGVVPGGLAEFITIQAAIDWCSTQATPAPSATTPYTVEIWPGIYDEQITMADYVHLKGVGPEGAVVIQQTDATVLFTGDNTEVNNVTIRLTTPTVARNLIDDNAQTHAVVFDRVRVEITTPAATGCHLWDLSGGSTIAIKRSYYAIGGTGGIVGIYTDTAAAQILLEDNNFGIANINAFHIQTNGVNTQVVGSGNRWTGTCGWISCNNGVVLMNHDSVVCTAGMNIVGGSVCIKKGRQQYEVLDGMWVQHAITAAAADTPVPSAAAPYSVLIHPGVYSEVITCATWVNLKGIGPPGSVVIQQTDANVLTAGAANVEIENLILRLVTPSASRRLIQIGNVAGLRFRDIVFEITTPGGFAHELIRTTGAGTAVFERLSYNITDAANPNIIGTNNPGAGTLTFIDCHMTINSTGGGATIIRNDQVGVYSLHHCTLAGSSRPVICTNGTVQLHNCEILNTQLCNITGGSCVAKSAPREYHVFAGMLIQHAIDAAAADTPAPGAGSPYTVVIHPGLYSETVTCADYVNLKGVDRDACAINQTDANLLTPADITEIENLTLTLVTPTLARTLVVAPAGAITTTLRNIRIEVINPGALNHTLLATGGGSVYTLDRVDIVCAGTGSVQGISVNGADDVYIYQSIVSINATGATASQVACVTAGAVVSALGNRFVGVAARGIYCSNGYVSLAECFYRRITRAGSGNIVDESPRLSDSPWKIHQWDWMTALASADIAVRGTPVDAGSGQVLLEVTDNVAGQEAVETNPEVAGSLGNEFTPARTPRLLMQISVDSFDADVTMFFGLRAALGNAVPGAAEHHAGFDWDGTNFRAVSSNGGGVGEQTNLTTPSTGAQHQLEVIIVGGVRVEFYVGGLLVATHSTVAGIPTATLDWQHLLATAGAGAGDVVQVTVRPGGCQECPA